MTFSKFELFDLQQGVAYVTNVLP